LATRLAVYTDYAYHRLGSTVYAERAFALFLARLASEVDRLVLIGRLDPEPVKSRYELGDRVDFVELPHYRSLADPLSATRGMLGSLGRFWRSLDEVDGVWILGPHPLALPFAAIGLLRRRRVMLGVRQDFPSYIRSRRPGRPLLRLAAGVLERSFRLLSRFCSTVVVGPSLARTYRKARRLLTISVSLIEDSDVMSIEAARERPYGGRLRILSVGRLDAEKNPLMLADVLAELRRDDPRWGLVVCGEGDMEVELAERFAALGLGESAELRGYVPLDEGLIELYRESHVLLHVSWTEGLPQILFEAFASGLPVVATDVGGISEAVDGAVSLISAGEVGEATAALRRVAADAAYREQLVRRGIELAHAHTLESEARRAAAFLTGD
jgi:glycosyltransferase involved in cell wall biosynthesis